MRYAKTETGLRVLRDRSVMLTARQRAAFVLCDARHPAEHVLANVHSMGGSADDIRRLEELGLVAELPEPHELQARQQSEALAARTPQERFAQAYPIATRLAAGLGLRGFTLNLAVEHALDYEDLCAVAARLRDAVGAEAHAPLHRALYG